MICPDRTPLCDHFKTLRILFLGLMIACAPLMKLSAQDAELTDTVKIKADKLLSMPFEDLMNVRVVTATKSLQQTGQVPATVLVITKEQIKLRGYRNLGEILNDLP